MSPEEQNLRAEIDRLRVLLRKVTDSAKGRKAFAIEIEPAPRGFALVVTGYSEEQEWRVCETVATYLNTLAIGGMRWTLSAIKHIGSTARAEGEVPLDDGDTEQVVGDAVSEARSEEPR